MMQQAPGISEPVVVNLTPPSINVAAGGEPAEMVAYVRNASPTVDQYSIEIENLDPSWYTITLQSVALFPGDSAPLPIKIHPPRTSQTRAGNYKFIVRARSQSDPSIVGVTKGEIQIGGYTNFQVDLAPKRATGSRGRYRLNISNAGNGDVQLDLSGRDPEANLNYSFRPSKPTVRAGSRQAVPVSVKPKGFHLVGEPTTSRFVLAARPVDGEEKDAKEVQGELVHTPRFRSWRWPLIILGVLALFLCLIITRPNINPCSHDFFAFPVPIGEVQTARFYAGWFCDNETFHLGGPTRVSKEGSCASGLGFTEVRGDPNTGKIVGQCIESEWGDSQGNIHQKTTTGQLLYIPPGTRLVDNKPKSFGAEIYFISDAGKMYTFTNCNPPGQFKACTTVEVQPASSSTNK